MAQHDFAKLNTAYGSAAGIPDLLQQASSHPTDVVREKAYFDLWSALWHQGDIYSASVAAVPMLMKIAEKASAGEVPQAYQLALSIIITEELSREFADLIDSDYLRARAMSKEIALRLLESTRDVNWKRLALAGLALSVDDVKLANFIIQSEIDLMCQHCEKPL